MTSDRPAPDSVHGEPARAKSDAATALAAAGQRSGVRAVFALPVTVATDAALTGGRLAAQVAAAHLLDVMSPEPDLAAHPDTEYGWEQLAGLERVEVYQATGMVALDVEPAEALVRLRVNAWRSAS